MSLKHAILAALSSKPQTGYELGRKVEGSFGFFWAATHQQIYRELAALEDQKLVTHKDVRQTERPDKKVYRITRGGSKELGSWIAAASEPVPVKDPLLIKLF